MTEEEERILGIARRRTRRSFLFALIAAVAGIFGWRWLYSRPADDGIPWPLRAMLRFNERLWRHAYSPDRLTPQPPAPPEGTPVRINGDLGLLEPLESWQLHVHVPQGSQEVTLKLTMEDLKQLPRTETTTQFKCIEGWTVNFSYAGTRFSDFIMAVQRRAPQLPLVFPYVALETPDRGYYVSIDMESMLHPQTVLAYEMNGRPLSAQHGAPLRLVIPIKYGIKSLKRVGVIRFADQRPPDYWAARGYDWYAGL